MRQVFVKYMFFLVLAGIAVTSSSFQKENLLNSSQNLLKSVPFKGKFTATLEANGVVSGTGTASHIGRFTLVEPNNLVEPNEGGFLVVTGTAIITAANGDEINATHTGIVQPLGGGTAQVDAKFTITGGTGRFTEATGSFESHSLANLALSTSSVTFYGTISY